MPFLERGDGEERIEPGEDSPGEQAERNEIEKFLYDKLGGRQFVLIHERRNGQMGIITKGEANRVHLINLILNVGNQLAKGAYRITSQTDYKRPPKNPN